MTQELKEIQNENGGGLSFEVSGKYTSVRHELARLSDAIGQLEGMIKY